MIGAKTYLTALVVAAGLALGSPALAESSKPASGTASWFGNFHHGKNTASGEPFDMFSMTAAHKKLPFGTVLRVTNNANGKTVVLKVNDRGPYAKKRILDVSYAAADRLGMRASGTAPITMEVVGDTEGRPLDSSKAFFVRLDESRSPTAATVKRQMSQLLRMGIQDAPTLLHTTSESIALGPFLQFQDAQETLSRVATVHPKATIMLASKKAATPAIGVQGTEVSAR